MPTDTPATSVAMRLAEVQAALQVPKSHRNTFGKYDYRNAEDILKAAKPLLHEHGLMLTISDMLVQVGDRYYVQATATVYATDYSGTLAVTAFAREAGDRKGMDDSQVTGSTSSYARKYALNGLFCLDDAQDADSDHHTRQRRQPPKPQSQRQVDPSTGEIADTHAPRSAEDAPGSTEGRIGTPDTPTPPPVSTAPQGVTPEPEWATVNKALHAEARKHQITHEHLKARAIAGARAHGRMITSLKELAPIALKGMLDAIKRDPADWKKRAEIDLNDPAIHSAVYPDREEEMF